MTIRSTFDRMLGGLAGLANGSAYPYRSQIASRIEPVELPQADLYRLLKSAYLTNGFYDELARTSTVVGRSTAQVKAIRSPIAPVVDFFGAKLYPEPLTVVSENAAIVDPLTLVWKWSNWRANRRTFARWIALYGEAYISVKADQTRGRVWLDMLEPMYVTDFEADERGFLTFIRIDIPKTDDSGETLKTMTHTETWSQDDQIYRRWLTDGDASGRRLRDLGPPEEEESLSKFGIDFVPLVRVPFKEIGEKRGIGAVQLALEPIAEADLSATNLHSMVYVDAEGAWVATAAGTDGNNRPLPPLRVAAAEPTFDSLGRQTSNGTGQLSDGSISVGKRSFLRLPGGYDVKSVVADIKYDAALAILRDHDEHLERLMPALSYARISEMSGADLSGRAIRFKLTPAIDQVTEVRATALEKLQQADAMALTLGQVNGIPGFDGLGSFDEGDFEHEFEDVDVIPIGDYEQAQTEALDAQAYGAWRTAGLPDVEALQRAGYSKTEATRIVRLATQEAEAAMQRQQEMMGQMEQQQDQGGQGV